MNYPTDRKETKNIILQVLGTIPKGKVCTYGGIAALAGMPRHARYVGAILKNLPTGSKIPWHRVINSKGGSSFPAGSDRWLLQQQRLLEEGIVMTGDKVNLKQFLWKP